MNLQEFINTYSGKNVNEDGSTYLKPYPGDPNYGSFQCVALVKWYMQAVWNVPQGRGDANVFIRNLSNDQFEKSNTPQIGDIVSFNGRGHGHIGIVTEINNAGFKFLEQNGGSGNSRGFGGGNDAIRIRQKNGYSGVIGFARPKNQNSPLSRKNIAEKIFRDLAGSTTKNGKTASNIWNGSSPNNTATRYEVAAMIQNYFSRVENRGIDMTRIWNASRPNDAVSEYELGVMIGRAKSL